MKIAFFYIVKIYYQCQIGRKRLALLFNKSIPSYKSQGIRVRKRKRYKLIN